MSKKTQNTLIEAFHFTRSERNGLLVLSSIILLGFTIPTFFPYFVAQEKIDFSSFQEEITNFKTNENIAQNTDNQYYKNNNYKNISLFQFDPNTASVDDFMKLGLPKFIAERIEKFRNKGGKFYKKEDFQKIYGLRPNDYERLLPYIQTENAMNNTYSNIKSTENKHTIAQNFQFDPNTASIEDFEKLGLPKFIAERIEKYKNSGGKFYKKEDFQKIYGLLPKDYERLEASIVIGNTAIKSIENQQVATKNEPKPMAKSYTPVSIDINKASEEDWQKVRGIGAYFAKKIVGFREKLGGFASIEQVKETYNLPDSTFQKIKPQLQISSPVLKKIAINKATIDDLKAHPYLKWKQAEAIVNYKNQHGNYKNIEDLKKIVLLNAETLQKIQPYLSFD